MVILEGAMVGKTIAQLAQYHDMTETEVNRDYFREIEELREKVASGLLNAAKEGNVAAIEFLENRLGLELIPEQALNS